MAAQEPMRRNIRLRLGAATFGVLALELALIRWTSSQIRLFAYFNNLVLIGAFLGVGLGVAVGRRRPSLGRWTLPALVPLAAVLALSDRLGLMHMSLHDRSVALWGAERVGGLGEAVLSLAAMIALLWAVIGVFVLAGAAVGDLFGKLPALTAYSADLAGSLLGVVALAAAAAAGTGPHVWLLAACVPFVYVHPRPSNLVAAAIVVGAAWLSGLGAHFSPYNRIDLEREDARSESGEVLSTGYKLSVNRDFHQYMHDLSEAATNDPRLSDERRAFKRLRRDAYDIPFALEPRKGRALVVAAGTGNDVQAALRNGYREVYSVDIDGTIIELGRRLHPERPYDDPRVRPVVNDARAFFEQHRGEPFDVVCYGLLDSHAMFSAMSSLRLENYVYTVEGIRAAWRLTAPEGVLAISFSVFAGDWIAERLYWTVTEATGVEPVVLNHGMQRGYTFVAARDPSLLDSAALGRFPRVEIAAPRSATRVTSDDWPFLYVRPGQVPWAYFLILGAVLAGGFLAAPAAFGRSFARGGFDPPLFLMGAAFLLLETRGVTTLSLLFGSTWIVNASVFSGILAAALGANLLVQRLRPARPEPWFAPLLLSVLVVLLVDPGVLNRFSLPTRGVLGGLLIGAPIGFAGILVSTLLARSPDPPLALGSNLLGALVGGCLEYFSMFAGMRAMAGVALLLYLGAFAALRLRAPYPAASAVGASAVARPPGEGA